MELGSREDYNDFLASEGVKCLMKNGLRQGYDRLVDDGTYTLGCCTMTSLSLESAKKKLSASFPLENLPCDRQNPMWTDIKESFDLTLAELSALKNSACPNLRARGVLPSIRDGDLYRISDERVRAKFSFTNHETARTMSADLMVYSGAESELKLPGRKVAQLGLRQVGGPVPIIGTTNHVGMVLNFFPVLVSATFYRDGTEEIIEAYLTVRTNKDEYEQAKVEHQQSQQSAQSPTVALEPGGEEEPPSKKSRTESEERITTLELSPVRHSPKDKPNEQAIIGIRGLRKLRMHLNGELQRLEIEEETALDPEW